MIVPPHDPDRQKRQNEMARKAILLAARRKYTDHNGRISPEGAKQARIDAGIDPAPAPPKTVHPDTRLAHLEAGEEAGLSLAQIDTLTGTTPDEISAEVNALREPIPPGDGGARTPVAAPDPIAQAEANGDWKTSSRLKTQKLMDLKQAKAERNHPNAR